MRDKRSFFVTVEYDDSAEIRPRVEDMVTTGIEVHFSGYTPAVKVEPIFRNSNFCRVHLCPLSRGLGETFDKAGYPRQ